MSSTIRTWRPLMSVSRSLRIRTTPEDCVPAPYEDTAIQSIVTGVDSARARSAITITAPLSTPTISRSLPAYSASIFEASSASLASMSSLVMSTFSRSAPMSFASTRITFGRPTGRSGPPRDFSVGGVRIQPCRITSLPPCRRATTRPGRLMAP